jgi:hypothetical protein
MKIKFDGSMDGELTFEMGYRGDQPLKISYIDQNNVTWETQFIICVSGEKPTHLELIKCERLIQPYEGGNLSDGYLLVDPVRIYHESQHEREQGRQKENAGINFSLDRR